MLLNCGLTGLMSDYRNRLKAPIGLDILEKDGFNLCHLDVIREQSACVGELL